MKIAVEVSLYPLCDSYLSKIQAVVERLNSSDKVKAKTNAMSTQLTGELADVMALIQTEIEQTFTDANKAVFVCKFLNSELDF